MENREILKEIVLSENFDNISFNKETFTLKLGDILNTDPEGNQYYLLGTYVEIPYNFEPIRIRLHREIVNEFECSGDEYSGFVHYNGYKFCWGESGVDTICNIIRMDGLDSDKFNLLLIKLNIYLSNSSHGSAGLHRKIEFPSSETNRLYEIKDFIEIDGFKYPLILLEKLKSCNILKVDYSEPYTIIRTVPGKEFLYNNKIITPVIVRHKLITEIEEFERDIRLNIHNLLENIEKEIIQKKINEINNKPKITVKDFLYKLTNQQCRVDGNIYI